MKADTNIEVRAVAGGYWLAFGHCFQRCSLSCSGSGRTGLRICGGIGADLLCVRVKPGGAYLQVTDGL